MIRQILECVTNAQAYHCKITLKNYVNFIGLSPALKFRNKIDILPGAGLS